MGQVASAVQDTAVEARSLALFNDRPGIGIDIVKAKGIRHDASGRLTADRVDAKVAEIRPQDSCGRGRKMRSSPTQVCV